ELFGLFLDAGGLELALLALLGVVALLVHETSIDTTQAAVLLVAGNMAVLMDNVVRSSARDRSGEFPIAIAVVCASLTLATAACADHSPDTSATPSDAAEVHYD